MHVSDKGLELLKRFEGLRLEAYLCPAGKWTIGYGHTGPDVRAGSTIDDAAALDLLRSDVARFERGVSAMAGECTQSQFDALVSFAFNIGLGALMSSTLLKKHKAGDPNGAAAQFGRWVYGGGRELKGLLRRRAAEAELYAS